MESKNSITYDVEKSAERIDKILNSSNSNFADSDSIPPRTELTYDNGRYIYVTAMFVDIVGSSDMTDSHKRPTLAKIYRSFISECVALMNSQRICKEINIHGDCVWGVFDTPLQQDIDKVFSTAACINSMIEIMNYKLAKKKYNKISIGIGIDYGRALMVQAGYAGSAINDVIWMGDVVNSASKLCNKAGRNSRKPIILSSIVYDNLNDDNKKLLSSIYYDNSYECNIVNCSMQKWIEENCD